MQYCIFNDHKNVALLLLVFWLRIMVWQRL